jgi:hypothetical protein
MGVDVAANLFHVELRQRRIIGTRAGDQDVVDRCGQLVEEPPEPVEIDRIERGDAGAELKADMVQAVRVARSDDHLSSLLARQPGGLETNAGAASNHHEGLPEQVPLVLHGRLGGRGSHGSSQGRCGDGSGGVCPHRLPGGWICACSASSASR